ncbi:MAG: molybdenum cofactor guanylyltransferase [Candidatus Bathyarchaeia archaeon]
MKFSAIILAGGFSKRLGQEKALTKLAGKPLILHVLGRVPENIDEKLVVVSSENQKETFEKTLEDKAKIVLDVRKMQSPLVGAYTGFKNVNSDYSLLLACDTPFVSSQILAFLIECCVNKSAAIPRWPNGYIEPLQAAYNTKIACTQAENALNNGELNLRSMIARMRNIRYISTLVLQQIDPKLRTFFNINTPLDLKRAESLLSS